MELILSILNNFNSIVQYIYQVYPIKEAIRQLK